MMVRSFVRFLLFIYTCCEGSLNTLILFTRSLVTRHLNYFEAIFHNSYRYKSRMHTDRQ
jgi:hypothetical protein